MKFKGTLLDLGQAPGQNLADPSSAQDFSTKNYVDKHTLLPGSRLVVFGHSVAADAGAMPQTRGWAVKLAGMLRGRMWEQAVGGARLADAGETVTTTGYGGISQLLQGAIPHPSTPINWRGAYSSAVTYAYDDGVTSGGVWYRQCSGGGLTNVAPPGNGWIAVSPSSVPGTYEGIPYLPILMYGNNDLGQSYQKNYQAFLSALQTALARLCCAYIWENDSPNITYAGGIWTNNIYGANPVGSGASFTTVPNTPGATITFQTPPDWPGGYVDMGFLGGLESGELGFTVDGSNVNVLCSGQAPSNLVNFGPASANPRNINVGTELTTALASGVAVTVLHVNALSQQIVSGDTISVGTNPAQVDTFTASATAAVGANTISVTSHAPTNNHPIGDSLADPLAYYFNDIVVRVPVPAGNHTVVATVQSGFTVANLYFDYVGLESPIPPPVIVCSLVKMLNQSLYWPVSYLDSDIDSWNAAIQGMIGAGHEFPNAVYVDIANVLKPQSTLTTALTLGQTGVTALAVTALPYAVATGDILQLGSGLLVQNVTVAAPGAAKGAASIPVTSFTSTYAQPIGASVCDINQVVKNFWSDAVHPSDIGHTILAQQIYDGIQALNLTEQQAAALSGELGQPVVHQIYTAGSNLNVGTGVANAWGLISGPSLTIPADPGDVLEISLAAIWNAVSGISGWLDIATVNKNTGLSINFVSGVISILEGLGNVQVGGQATNGISSFISGGSSATQFDNAIGTFLYPVQGADLINGAVTLRLAGKSSSTTPRTLICTSGNQIIFFAKNRGPVSGAGLA